KTMVVAVTFAVGGNMDELPPMIVLVGKAIKKPLDEAVAIVEQSFESNGARERAVVEEDRDGAATAKTDQIRPGGVNGGFRSLGPPAIAASLVVLVLKGHLTAAVQGANARALVRREDDETDALLGKQLKRERINGGFGQPHALGHSLKAALEVGNAPA